MDTATSEYLFCCSFFQEDAIFHELFAATLAVVESSLAAALQVRDMLTPGAMQDCRPSSCPGIALLCFAQRAHSEAITRQETFDLVGLLLMIRVNYHHQLLMAKRRIPCLDDYLDRTNLLLWPRFKVSAMRLHLLPATSATCCPEHRAGSICGGRPAGRPTLLQSAEHAAGAPVQAMLDVQLQSIKGYNAANWGPDIAVHMVTQRYAQLTTSLLLLNADYQARP